MLDTMLLLVLVVLLLAVSSYEHACFPLYCRVSRRESITFLRKPPTGSF